MQGFGQRRRPSPGDIAIWVKIRVTSGCFHREHSPCAYELIDSYLARSAVIDYLREENRVLRDQLGGGGFA